MFKIKFFYANSSDALPCVVQFDNQYYLPKRNKLYNKDHLSESRFKAMFRYSGLTIKTHNGFMRCLTTATYINNQIKDTSNSLYFLGLLKQWYGFNKFHCFKVNGKINTVIQSF